MATATTAPAPAGPQAGDFSATDWALVALVAGVWGSSFFLVEVGLERLAPTVVAFLRVFFGALALAAFPAARRAVPREAWRPIALLGLVWMAVPLSLFPIAQQWIDSSLAGMINAAAPLFTAAIAAGMARRLPGGWVAAGLAIGFAGVVLLALPSFGEEESSALGVVFVVIAALLYGLAFNLAAPLQRRYGAMPVIWRAELVSVAVMAPAAAAGVPSSSFGWDTLAAMLALGALGTGIAYVAFTTLVGRVGPTRGSVTIYFIPVVAIALGVTFRDEPIAVLAIAGVALILLGAYLTGKRSTSRT